MGFIGVQELLVILLIILVLFGAKKIPELAKGLGTGLKEFRKASKDLDKELTSEKVENSSVDDSKNSQ
ncbi:MAG: twin-arginine translocase TatA/TatE family subunit [Fibromonadales bacterium]|jgi:sec-independent protein translocase protein TatA|nr:twin-arginine translocase TatA/TatE family subunit [Fibromonadales bacterium]